MNYLALDTSTEGATVGVKSGTEDVMSACIDAPRRHGRDLVPRLREVLERAGVRPIDLDVVAVGLGPGSYTGLRIGLAAAKVLAYVSGASIVGIDSLEVVAANAPRDALPDLRHRRRPARRTLRRRLFPAKPPARRS